MGMYTELVLKCEIKKEVPEQVQGVLMHLFGGEEAPESLPDHKFFNCTRWGSIGRDSSFYHTPFALSKYENVLDRNESGGHIFSRSDLKNYDGEIQLFIEWLTPYIYGGIGDCIGWSWYEEDDKPTLLVLEKQP